jgi:hypothetical protein
MPGGFRLPTSVGASHLGWGMQALIRGWFVRVESLIQASLWCWGIGIAVPPQHDKLTVPLKHHLRIVAFLALV